MEITARKSIANQITNSIFLIVLNLVIISVIGYMTLDSEANFNSRMGGFLLSFFIPFFIVYHTKKMRGIERMLKFGFGIIAYFIASIIIVGIPVSFVTGLLPCLVIALGVLFYGGLLVSEGK